jgi:hypothetical protein
MENPSVIETDDKGDEFFEGCHVYTAPFSKEAGPFRPAFPITLKSLGGGWGRAEDAKRIGIFPRKQVDANSTPDKDH